MLRIGRLQPVNKQYILNKGVKATNSMIDKNVPLKEQRFLLPGYQTWEQFEAIEALMAEMPALRIFYLDGWIELMTNSSEYERIKTNLSSLVEA